MKYDYKCKNCGHIWEEDQKISDPKTEICPECGEKSAERMITNSGGFILKGSGWFNSGGY